MGLVLPPRRNVLSIAQGFGLVVAALVLIAACASTPEATRDRAQNAAGASSSCPSRTRATGLLPGVKPEEATLAYWLERYSQPELDQVLMDDAAIAAYNMRVGRRPGRESFSQRDLRVPLDPLVLAAETRERLGSLRPDLLDGKLLASDNRAVADKDLAAFSEPAAPSFAATVWRAWCAASAENHRRSDLPRRPG